jgi:tetratricopeptide (TPR) repeat protein
VNIDRQFRLSATILVVCCVLQSVPVVAMQPRASGDPIELSVGGDSARSLYEAASALFDEGEFLLAIPLYEASVGADETLGASWIELGVCYYKTGQNVLARQALERARQLEPENTSVYTHLGILLGRIGELHEAVDYLRLAVAMDRDSAEAYHELAVVYSSLGEEEKAIDGFLTSIELDPHNAEAHDKVAVLMDEVGRFQEAVSHFGTAVVIDPDFAQAYKNWGTALARRKLFVKAIERYEQALARKADYAECHLNIAVAFDRIGQFDGAKEVGEGSMVPVLGSIANAIYDAIGVRITELPITPERVLAALAEKRGGS